MLFKNLILSIKITPEEHQYFIGICSDWGRYCDAITTMDRYGVMKLLKYLTEERPYSKRLLQRAISRFNRLNALRKEALK